MLDISLSWLGCQGGLNRSTAAEEASLSWGNIGDGLRQKQFLVVEKNTTETMQEVSSKVEKSIPMDMNGVIFRMVINLLEIKNRVDGMINSVS